MVDIKTSRFFDKPGVLKHVKDGTKSAPSKAGAFVRQRAKTSIRKRKKSSPPGSPPSSHAGQLRSMIYFGYDASTNSVVVGPSLFKSNNPTVPQLLEFGGTSIEGAKPATWYKFPYIRPVLEAEALNFLNLFSGDIKGG